MKLPPYLGHVYPLVHGQGDLHEALTLAGESPPLDQLVHLRGRLVHKALPTGLGL